MLIWLMFLLGQLMHLAVQVDAIARASNNTATSRWKILEDRWIPIGARIFGTSMLFGIVLGGGLPDIYAFLGSEAPAWTSRLDALMNSGVGRWMAGGTGLGVDTLMAFLPWTKTYVPPPISQEEAVVVKAFDKGVTATKQAVKEAVKEVEVTLPPVKEDK